MCGCAETGQYWIYNFKGGAYYSFVPNEGQNRDSSLEFRL